MGSLGVVPNFGQIYNPDSFTGDGSNTTFTLSHGVTSDQSILWIESGVVQKPGIDYTISGLTLTRTTAPANLVACFAMYLGVSVDVGTIGDASVTLAKMAVNSIDSDQYVDASIDNAHLADDAVGVAELSATGTASSSTFLRGDNAWAAPGGGGAWNFISTAVASDSASLTLTGITSTYDTYVVLLSDIIPATDGPEAQLQLGDSGGIDSGGSDYAFHVNYLIDTDASYAAQVSSGAAYIKVNANVGNATGEGMSATIYLGTPSDTSLMNLVYGNCLSSRGAGQLQGSNIFARRLTSIATTQVLFKFSSGNIASGRMSLYGIAHA